MQDGRTPLFVACINGHVELVEALLAAGCDKESTDAVRAASMQHCRVCMEQGFMWGG